MIDRCSSSPTLSWLVDASAEAPAAEVFLAELGRRLSDDGLPLAGGALNLAAPHPLIARRAWLWRATSGEVIEALGFVPASSSPERRTSPRDASRRWLASLAAAGVVHEDPSRADVRRTDARLDRSRPFTPDETGRLGEAARFAATRRSPR